jgi:hypothetical protein
MGLPVIAPAWSGQTEFLTEQNSLPLPVAHLAPAYEHEPQLLTSAGHTLTQPQRAAHQVRESHPLLTANPASVSYAPARRM